MRGITVVGVGADGLDGLTPAVRGRVLESEVVIGGERHLAMLPPIDRQIRVGWPTPLMPGLRGLLAAHADRGLVVLASGDPLLSGIGTALVRMLGADAVDVLPAVSSETLARARMGWSAEDTALVTLVGRDPRRVVAWLAPRRRLVVLSSDETTPARVADLLVAAGYGDSALSVLGDLGAAGESRVDTTAATWGDRAAPRLNVVCIECAAGPETPPYGSVPGLPDDAYDSDGLVTKRDVRASAVARLVPAPGHVLWDVGAGAGSIGIEWMRAAVGAKAVAIEPDPLRAQRCRDNAAWLGVPDLEVVVGTAPGALGDLKLRPDAVFVGGGASVPGVLEEAWAQLRSGGRFVAHAVTVESEDALLRMFREHGGEMVRLSVERLEPLGTLTGWKPARAVTQWSAIR
ncbi:UNVERIFIED_CONTAM: hypothetical protein LK11_02725 [Mumia flava]|nr:precorrin-6y C5,15-methyltransferase (decarboxylating) subunit CbiE [Mumia flava]